MLAILKLFIFAMIIILAVSAICGVIAFFIDLHNFKSEKQLSLPRKKLIEKLLLEEELKRMQELTKETSENKTEEKTEETKGGEE